MHSIKGLVQAGASHLGIATRTNYKSGDGLPPQLLTQCSLLEEGLTAWGLTVWPMVEFEPKDALASAAAQAALDPQVDQVFLCSLDKILAQCVQGRRVVQYDGARKTARDAAAVLDKFGIPPASIPDYLALVGDPAHDLPGLPGWGARSAAAVLSRFPHLEAIPDDHTLWDAGVARPASLAAILQRERAQAELFRRRATLHTDVPLFRSVDQLAWRGPTPDLPRFRRRVAVMHRAPGSHPRSE